ncbi:MAG: 30S ribosomal protein S9 [Candidatus Nealsonbacteria bacterium CG_4_9_14_3_um_filter_35_11]|uniref:Small ribosomal subunit protein uS9 n=2 Tax=Candidatus Nealsoniibacteriota TaxID=1817911 RepID=A0A2M7DBD3_9BACT|nr:MAG: 30S ribosomal protein S9 [Candidatus Nealsonbacteria bacterium CG11_big_fil_rev_8_21_14_0_20_35_11]PIV45740.1 MAG: 30S ribosomal protein S9 [Candidatus Nealsonbacteria bacterium CG02_land_8_20_14_3_00_34_20]PIW92648.1 MAG: 30S ribosomal protein S9 [Candidatus Nealsonbacteria bacterium CG_4_8_14_3_um_filter_34_13]PIZ90105.1 MAG: 30S ribosomal protein S9 [Candidatus Nealsonbacteria bacterium CG_4_10_14_0_2_um_filter_35_20]PJA84764.1 MAG: 30S ribosomal protein S9 [Candidatus Nealsonbacteri
MPKTTAKKTTTKKKKKPESPKKVAKKKIIKKKVVLKEVTEKKIVKEKPEPTLKPPKYFEATGRRKTATSRVRLFTQGEKGLIVNNKDYQGYFFTFELQQIAVAALNKMKSLDRFRVLVKVRGGGLHSQAEATRYGIAQALVKFNPDYRKRLKKAGFLTRDPRKKERKKFGLKGARRAPQWSKR